MTFLRGNTEDPSNFNTKILICVTIYDESLEELMKTLRSIVNNFKNLGDMEQKVEAEREIGVVVIQDGMNHLDESFKSDEKFGIFKEGVIQKRFPRM